MKNNDRRSHLIALVADSAMNPGPGRPDHLQAIAERGWGVIGLPPERLGQTSIRQWIAGVGDQVREFRRHGMIVVAVLDPRDKIVAEELARMLAEPPPMAVPVHDASGKDPIALTAFLDGHAAHLDRTAAVKPTQI